MCIRDRFLTDLVCRNNQYHIDNRIEKAYCRGIAIIAVNQADFIYIGGNNRGGLFVQGILKQEDFFKAHAHQGAHLKDQKHDLSLIHI